MAKVEFGAVAGTKVRVKSSRKLTVRAPKHSAGVVDVRVEVKLGSTVKTSPVHAGDHYTYYARPTVKGVSSSTGSTTGGAVVTISGTAFHSIRKVEFGTVFGTGLKVASSTRLKVVVPKHAAGSVDVRVIGRYGTSAVTSKSHYRYAVPTPAWHAVQAPLPSHASAPQVDLVSVACAAATSCAAVGNYHDANGNQQGLLDVLTGTSWVGGKTPLPAMAASSYSNLVSVSCPSSTSCIAVGSYEDTSEHEDALIDTRTSEGWTAAKAPLPSDAATSPNATLSAVACPAVTSCIAVGSYTDKTDGIEGLIETLTSGAWAATEAPLPSGAGATIDTPLGQVACWTTGSCVAIGTYLDATEEQEGVIERLTSGNWHAAAMPVPADHVAADQFVIVNGLSCDSAGDCAVAGGYSDSDGRHAGLIVTIDGGATAAVQAPLPANSDSSPDAELDAVSCVSGTTCAAVGYYFDTSTTGQGLLESISGDSAVAAEAPLPATADTVSLAAIACASSTCRATGVYQDDTGVYHALIDSQTNGNWSAINAPIPSNAYVATPPAVALTELDAVTPAGSGSGFVAVGQYPDTRIDNQGLIDSYS